MEQFFTDIALPVIDQATMESLDTPLSPEEIAMAISALQTNKSPGPDGLSFIKHFLLTWYHFY